MKNSKKTFSLIIAALMLAGLGAGAALAQEELYLYVATDGDLQPEVAETPAEAIATADDIALHSGVILAEQAAAAIPLVTLADADFETYLYVDVHGGIQTEDAATPAQAMNQAEDRDPNSGVMLIEE